jgi:hypothetical protein
LSGLGPRMPEHEIFIGLSEVAIVFAGFAGISVILSRDGAGNLGKVCRTRPKMVEH